MPEQISPLDPDDILPVFVNWNRWQTNEIGQLDPVVPTSVQWVIADGDDIQGFDALSTRPPMFVDGYAIAWFTGGTPGRDYSVICRAASVGGRHKDWTVVIPVRTS